MEMSEFLQERPEEEEDVQPTDEELSVQKAVVESLAAEKVEQDERIIDLEQENRQLKRQITDLQEKLAAKEAEMQKLGDALSDNSNDANSNKIALLDRNIELDDKFEGETRDQVIEVIKEARAKAEAEGQLRRAQILEGVLVCNESSGNLSKKIDEIKDLFVKNENIVSGTVIEELKKLGISHKSGDEYLLPSEIIKRVYF